MWDAFQHFQTLSHKAPMIRVPWKWASRTTCAISRIPATWKAAFMRAEAATQAPLSLRCVARYLYVCFIAFVLRSGKQAFSSYASLHGYFTRIPAVPSSKLLLEKEGATCYSKRGTPGSSTFILIRSFCCSASLMEKYPGQKSLERRRAPLEVKL